MLTVLSRRRQHQHGRYEKLADDEAPKVELRRSVSVTLPPQTVDISAKSGERAAKIHPVLSMLDGGRRRKKDPKLGRYLEYLKEGGVWDDKSNAPRMYYK